MQHQIQKTFFLYLSDISIYKVTAVFHEIGSCSKADPQQNCLFHVFSAAPRAKWPGEISV